MDWGLDDVMFGLFPIAKTEFSAIQHNCFQQTWALDIFVHRSFLNRGNCFLFISHDIETVNVDLSTVRIKCSNVDEQTMLEAKVMI
jgi:hypothetical protein